MRLPGSLLLDLLPELDVAEGVDLLEFVDLRLLSEVPHALEPWVVLDREQLLRLLLASQLLLLQLFLLLHALEYLFASQGLIDKVAFFVWAVGFHTVD